MHPVNLSRYAVEKLARQSLPTAFREALCELGNAASEGSVDGISYIGWA